MKNYYKILGVREEASQEIIKLAFRNLMKKYHPDINSSRDATKRTKEVSEAYSVLSCPNSRLIYDEKLKKAGLSSKVLYKKSVGSCMVCNQTGKIVTKEIGTLAGIRRWLGLPTTDVKKMCLDCLGTGYVHRLEEY